MQNSLSKISRHGGHNVRREEEQPSLALVKVPLMVKRKTNVLAQTAQDVGFWNCTSTWSAAALRVSRPSAEDDKLNHAFQLLLSLMLLG